MKKAILLLLMTTLSVLVCNAVFAQGLALRSSPRLMQGIRPLGMGGAFIATQGVDENALFYNPASINDFPEEIHMQFALPSVEMSYKAIGLATDVLDLADDIDAAGTDAAKINVFDNFTNSHTGRVEEVGVHGSIANFMHKWVAASLFYDNRSVVALTNPVSSTLDVEAVSQFGLQAGSAYSFFDDMLKAGLALKFIGRHMVDETITQREILANNNFGDILTLDQFGFGVGVDLGVKGRLPIEGKVWDYLDPVFAGTIQDIGHTRFTNNMGQIKESTTFGFALHPNYWKLKSIFAFDIRDVEHRSDILYKLHAGYEVTWPEIGKVLRSASVRLGMGQGYISGGFGLDFKYFKLNAATWGREQSNQTYRKHSRMFGLQLAAGF